ncbi:hypothetical protein ACFX58_18345 [Sphingomonas sp. NCPPB 2930]
MAKMTGWQLPSSQFAPLGAFAAETSPVMVPGALGLTVRHGQDQNHDRNEVNRN